jgi:photosystem II stability/assembly factor-like uncharacterized protein
MYKKKYLVLLILGLLISTTWQWQVEAQSQKRGKSYPERKIAEKAKESLQDLFSNDELEKLDLSKKRKSHFYQQRAFPFQSIPLEKHLEGVKKITSDKMTYSSKFPSNLTEPLKAIGPAPIVNGQTEGGIRGNVTGRVTALAMDPRNTNTIYLGGAQGGVWRTTNAGQSWTPLTDNAPTQAVGAIAIDPSDSNIIYVGTGEGNLSGDTFFGMGILKSTDGGSTWRQFAADTFAGCGFNKIVVDPRNTNVIYASSTVGFAGIASSTNPQIAVNGIYKSTDGGQTFNPSLNITTNRSIGAFGYDIEMDPNNSNIIYATLESEGVFKTTNAGTSWTKLSGGLPTRDFGRPDVAVARSNNNIVYASFESLLTGDILDIYRSDNGGNTWTKVGKPQGNFTCQCSYDQVLEVDPSNPDNVYFGGVGIYRSTNGGQSWSDISRNTHVDFHAIIFTPGNSRRMFVGSDGGVWTTSDGGNTFINVNGNLSLTQFQSVSIHPTNPTITIGGTQDNGTNLFSGTAEWQHADDGDGGFARIDQFNPGTMYHTYFNVRGFIALARSDSGGALGSWRIVRSGINQADDVLFYAPFELDTNKPDTVYFGTFRLYRTTNKGENWLSISNRLTRASRQAISAIGIAKGAPVIYTGSSDGAVFTSKDDGVTFQDVTENLPQRYISDVAPDPKDPNTVYVSLSGFRTGHVFKSTKGGGSWQDISANLPDVPANALAINPNDSNNVFVGTDLGLFETVDAGKSWRLVPGMPMVAVFDIDVNGKLGILRLATHGRGMYETKLNVAPPPQAQDFTLAVSPANQSVMAGNNAAFTITSQAVGGFNQSIALAVTTNQTTVQANLAANSILPGANTTLTVNTTANTPAGNLTITITGTAGQIVKTQTVTLTIIRSNSAPTISPIANQSVQAGKTQTVSVMASDPDGNDGLKLTIITSLAFVRLRDDGNGNGIIEIIPALTDIQGGTVTIQVVDNAGLSAQTSFNVTIQPAIVVNSAVFAKPNLTLTGIGFGASGAKVVVNGQDITARITQQSDTAITLKGNKKKLNLVKGTNQGVITNSGGAAANFTFNF